MKSDSVFFLEEYRRCCAMFEHMASNNRRQKEFHGRLGLSMLRAYVGSISKITKGKM